MIVVTITRNNDKKINEFTIEGHAEFEHSGKDIICAGISAVSGTAIIGLERLLGLKPEIVVEQMQKENKIWAFVKKIFGLNSDREDDSEGVFLKCVIPEDISEEGREKADVILETMVLGIKDLSDQYKKFVKVLDKEV